MYRRIELWSLTQARTRLARPTSFSRRLLWALSVLGLLIACGALLDYRQPWHVAPQNVTLPADGAEHVAFHIRLPASLASGQPELTGPDKGPPLRLLQDASDRRSWYGLVQAPVTPGT